MPEPPDRAHLPGGGLRGHKPGRASRRVRAVTLWETSTYCDCTDMKAILLRRQNESVCMYDKPNTPLSESQGFSRPPRGTAASSGPARPPGLRPEPRRTPRKWLSAAFGMAAVLRAGAIRRCRPSGPAVCSSLTGRPWVMFPAYRPSAKLSFRSWRRGPVVHKTTLTRYPTTGGW